MITMKWAILLMLCIFSPRGCVLHKFFSNEVQTPTVEIKAPYGTLFPTSDPGEYLLAAPVSSSTPMATGMGWIIYGQDETHLKVEILKVHQTGTNTRIRLKLHDEMPTKPLSPLIIQGPAKD
jgi:hypothetical protein